MRNLLLGAAACLMGSTALADGAAGAQWSTPAGWNTDAPRPMRAATYKIAPAKGDSEGAECGVFFFGAGQGGSVDANIQRWVGQFEQADGKPASGAKTSTEKVKDLDVTRVEVAGTFTGGAGPMAPAGGAKKPGYKLLGAIVNAPQGPVFFKLTGPAKTVDGARADFDKLIKSITH